MKRVVFVGLGRAGKDTACDELSRATGWKNAGTTSVYLTLFVATRTGTNPVLAYNNRHRNRGTWRRLGDEMRRDDPARLVRDALAVGPITGGCRARVEIQAVRRESLADLIVWIDAEERLKREGAEIDGTVEFGPEEADVIVTNNGTEEEFRAKIQRLGAALL